MSKHNGSNIICTGKKEKKKKKHFSGSLCYTRWRPDEEMMDPLVQRTSGLSQRIPPARRRRRWSRNNIGEPLCQIIVPRRHTHKHTQILYIAHACELVCVVSYKTYYIYRRDRTRTLIVCIIYEDIVYM